ncbi:MAG: hypothetical protein KatS3mg131_2700 [Candidatus Tectimicrobiota bacterium]|nr:MAG: hypothetical protein KatS3mg131_2700 [Candidatus Tectomicrobia bacterium]
MPIGYVATPADLYASPQLQARGFFERVEHPELGTLLLPTAAYRFSQTPWRLQRPAPRLGEHNAEVYGELGYTAADLVALRQCGVI